MWTERGDHWEEGSPQEDGKKDRLPPNRLENGFRLQDLSSTGPGTWDQWTWCFSRGLAIQPHQGLPSWRPHHCSSLGLGSWQWAKFWI